MIRQFISLSVVALFVLFAVSVRGEDAAPVSHAEFQKAIDELKEQIRSLKVPAASAPPTAANISGGTAGTAAAVKPNPEADLVQDLARLKKQVANLEAARKEQNDLTADHSKMLRDIAMGRATAEGGQRFVPTVQAISDDLDARRVLVNTVVHDMARSTGELRIRNDTGTGQSLVVNGVDTVYVPSHSARTITVPSGTATTELAGEGTKSWMIGAPNYSQEVVVAPAMRNSAWQYDPVTNVWWRTLQ